MMDNLKPHQRRSVTVNGNAGRWCTGLAPVKQLNSMTWPTWVPIERLGAKERWEKESYVAREPLDELFSVLYNTGPKEFSKCEYVVGWAKLPEHKLYSCHL